MSTNYYPCLICMELIPEGIPHTHLAEESDLSDHWSPPHSNSSEYSSSNSEDSCSCGSSTPKFKQEMPPSTPLGTCPVCASHYNSNKNLPRVLPSCGHTVCSACLQMLHKKNSFIRCFVCGQFTFKGLEELPVNYALLEVTLDRTETCSEHKMDLVAYCLDDEKLLCGPCIFEHKMHNCFLLTDEKFKGVLETQKHKLSMDLDELKKMKAQWSQALSSVEANYIQIEAAAIERIQGLERAEEQLITTIREKTQASIRKVKGFVKNHKVSQLKQAICDKVKEIEEGLQTLGFSSENFDGLSIVQKMKKVTVVQEKPPEISKCVEDIRALKEVINYEAVIQQDSSPVPY